MPGPHPPSALAALKPATEEANKTAAKRYFMFSPVLNRHAAYRGINHGDLNVK
jgi:hypothetical protein